MRESPPNPLVRAHQELNQSTRDAWERYADHRQAVMSLLTAPLEQAKRALLLGAGNCNDIDLAEVARACDEVALIDIDVDACNAARARLPEADRTRVTTHLCDVSGVLAHLSTWKTVPPPPAEMRSIPAQASAALSSSVTGPFDLVVSAGVLSQLIWSAMETLGIGHPALRGVALTAMMAHVQLALDQLATGGTLLLAVDTVARTPDIFAEWTSKMTTSELLLLLERDSQCLPATEPSVLMSAIAHAAPGARATLAPPWLWPVARRRTSLVYAILVERPAV